MSRQDLSSPGPVSKRNLRLVQARFNAGMTQRDLAEASGLSRTAIADLEAGAQPKPSNAKAIADALECQPLDLFNAAGTDSAEPTTGRAA